MLKQEKIDVIFHTAVTQVLDGLRDPKKCYETNILGTTNLLEAVRRSKKKIIFIFSSSDKAYGKLKTNNMYYENDKLLGDFTYDASKSASDIISQSYSKTYDLNIGIIRSGNIFGPGDLNFERLIPGLAFNSLKNKKLNLRSNGKNRRDYIYVEDVVEGYEKLMKKMLLKKSGNIFIFNLGSNYNYSVVKVCRIFLNLINKKNLQPIIKNNSKIEIPYQKLNYKKVKKELNWTPKTKFKTGLQKTYEWYNQNFKKISLVYKSLNIYK